MAHTKKNWQKIFRILCLFFFLISPTFLSSFPSHLADKKRFCPTTNPIDVSGLTKKWDLSTNLRYFGTANTKLSLDEILTYPDNYEFKKSGGLVPNFGNTELDYWLCFQIINKSETEIRLISFLKYPLLDEVDFYDVFSNGTYFKSSQGRLYPLSLRDVKYRGFGHLIILQANEIRTIFIRLETQSSMSAPLFIAKEKDFYEFAMEDLILQGIYFGIVGVMAVFNLFVFFLVRDKAYFFYVVYLIFSSILFQLSLNGLYPLFFFPDLPALVWSAHNYFYFLFILSVFPMSISFMNLKENSKPIYRVFVAGMSFTILCLLLMPFPSYRLMNQIGDAYVMILAILALITSFYIAIKVKYRPAFYFFFAFLVVIIGGISTLLKDMGFLSVNTFTENSFQLSMAIEVVLMAFGLGDRIAVVRKEKEGIQLRAEINKQKLILFHKELLLAKKLQESTLPQALPNLPGIEIHTGYIPASAVGGDFYDITEISEQEISCVIADVTGHGVPAAIEAAMLKIAYGQSIPFAQSPGKVLEKINQSLAGKYKNQLLTASSLYINLNEMILKVANAGHPSLYLLQKKTRNIREIRPKGKLIGFSKDLDYPEEEYELNQGDRILLYTDGLWEIWERDAEGNKTFSDNSGEHALLNWLQKKWDHDLKTLAKEMNTFIKKRTVKHSPEDDITFILFAIN